MLPSELEREELALSISVKSSSGVMLGGVTTWGEVFPMATSVDVATGITSGAVSFIRVTGGGEITLPAWVTL